MVDEVILTRVSSSSFFSPSFIYCKLNNKTKLEYTFYLINLVLDYWFFTYMLKFSYFSSSFVFTYLRKKKNERNYFSVTFMSSYYKGKLVLRLCCLSSIHSFLFKPLVLDIRNKKCYNRRAKKKKTSSTIPYNNNNNTLGSIYLP